MGFFLVFASSCEKNDDNDSSSTTNATNEKTTAEFNPSITYETMTDIDGNTYKTVAVGAQIWMAENLRTTKYNDGSDIPNVTDSDEWSDVTTGAYSNYKNTNSLDTIATYGRLYNWYAVNTDKLCPTGWHEPSDAEWTELADYLEGDDVAGGKLKEADTTHWISPNEGATNPTGFTALPGGSRRSNGKFSIVGTYGYWWSSKESDINNADHRVIGFDRDHLGVNSDSKNLGLSVRCVRN